MSALIYCDNGATHFEEMCPLAQFVTVVYTSFIPFCVVGSVITIATVCLVRKLHTPHEYIQSGIAVSDFIVGVLFAPMHVMNLLPEAQSLVTSQRWSCTLFLHMAWYSSSVQLDMLVIACLDSLLMVNKPVWYLNHVTRRKTVILTVGVQVVRIAVHIIGVIYYLLGSALDTPWAPHRCSAQYVYDIIPEALTRILAWILFFQILICIGLCLQVVIKSWLFRHKMTDTNWIAAFLLGCLTCSCIVLWMPTLVYIASLRAGLNKSKLNIMNDQGRLWRLLYSTLNAPICAATRPRYRMSFRFLLTTPPWRWEGLNRWLNRTNMFTPATGATGATNSNSRDACPYIHPKKIKISSPFEECKKTVSISEDTSSMIEYKMGVGDDQQANCATRFESIKLYLIRPSESSLRHSSDSDDRHEADIITRLPDHDITSTEM